MVHASANVTSYEQRAPVNHLSIIVARPRTSAGGYLKVSNLPIVCCPNSKGFQLILANLEYTTDERGIFFRHIGL